MRDARSSPAEPARSPRTPRALGRLVARGLYYLVLAGIIGGATAQIAMQIFVSPPHASPYPSCEEGLRALFDAVERARTAASGTDGEDAAIARFRSAIEPEWTFRDAIDATCQGSGKGERTLDAIERLRYAEEHAVRREAGDLAPLRRRVRAIVETDLAIAAHGSAARSPPRAPERPTSSP